MRKNCRALFQRVLTSGDFWSQEDYVSVRWVRLWGDDGVVVLGQVGTFKFGVSFLTFFSTRLSRKSVNRPVQNPSSILVMSSPEQAHPSQAEGSPDVEVVKTEIVMENEDEPRANTKKAAAPVPGNSLTLPLARVKRIIKQDEDIVACSTSAVYAIASATVGIHAQGREEKTNMIRQEMFVQYLTEQALLRARLEKRKRMHYNDFADAVASIDQLQFLNCKFLISTHPGCSEPNRYFKL